MTDGNLPAGVDSPSASVFLTSSTRPVRTCIGCRRREIKANLVRIASVDGQVVVDSRAVQPGRGAYLHPHVRCIDLALRRRAFGRALRLQGEFDTDAVRQYFNQVETDR